MLFCGDCLKELKKIKPDSVDLIYLDPPFFTQKTLILKTRDNAKEYYFKDNWETIAQYKTYLKKRLFECKRVLKETGSIFLHCDKTASHHLRIVLDNVFGVQNFQSEIIWFYKRWSNAKKGLLNAHQTIFFYSKTSLFKFNPMFDDYSPTTNIDQIFQKRVRDENGKTKYKKQENGDYELIDQKKGVPLNDVWEIPYLNPKATERTGYPTQKPILLLNRIIQFTTDQGDTVLDPFCGSGSMLVAAKLSERNFIGIDTSKEAIELTKSRLKNPIKTESKLLKKGKEFFLNKESDILQILKEIDATPVQRNKGIDGFLNIKGSIQPIPVRIQRKEEILENVKNILNKAASKNKFKLKVLISKDKMFCKPESDLFVCDKISCLENKDLFFQANL